jgi:[protein-PII] uridylyltransferase
MPNLPAKFEADAAALLVMPPGHMPGEALARYRRYRKQQEARLKMFHRAGASGREYCRTRAAFIDVLLRYLWAAARSTLSPQAQKEFPPLALVAIGGYGRGELNPFSDLDFMVLHEGQVVAGSKPLPHLTRILDGVVMPLFDFGFKVGYSVRTVSECVQVANLDMPAKTSLIEARLITGDETLFAKLQQALVARSVNGREEAYLAARLEDQAKRRAKFGNSATMQEPNIKNGCGGLRDYQNLHWMAFFKYRARSLAELQARAFLTATEHKQLDAAYDFLLRARNELHYQANRTADVLTKSLQPTVAHHLGYGERSPARRIERFMRDLYIHMRHLHLITRTLEERLALSPGSSRLASLRRLIRQPLRRTPEPEVDGFRLGGGQVHAAGSRVFREAPYRLMRVFLHAQQRGLRLHPDTARLIRQNLALVDRAFLADPHVRQTFLQILSQRGSVGATLRAMDEVGLLGKYVPEFGRLTCLVQHEFFHLYAADEHTLKCLEELDRIWAATEPPQDKYRDLYQGIERPSLLHLALLLHDAGKAGSKGKHSAASAQLALRVARRLALDGATTQALCLLVERHLVMAQVSQRHDLDDPAVIERFARLVQTPQNLSMLTLLTVADAHGTSDRLWNGFKDTLLRTLHRRALDYLHGGTVTVRIEEQQRESLTEQVTALLPSSLAPEEVKAHFAALPPRYYQIHSVQDIATDLVQVHDFMHQQVRANERPLEPVISWHDEPDRAYTRVQVTTWDRGGLFSRIAGSLSASGINILSAQVFTRSDAVVLDTFFVTDAHSGGLVPREGRARFEGLLRQALTDGVEFGPLIARQRSARPLYQPVAGLSIPTRLHFDNDLSETRTVLEIETEDRVGLLHVISQVLSECHLDISLAKITTERGAAIDTFYLAEANGQKILGPDRQRFIMEKLRTALAALG